VLFLLVIRNSSNKRRIKTALLIRGRRLLTFFPMRRLFKGGAYSVAALIRVNTVILVNDVSDCLGHGVMVTSI